MDNFDINTAIEKYNNIAYAYQRSYITKEKAQLDINELNKQCEEAGVTFKAEFKSLELHVKDEESYDDESYSYDPYGDTDDAGSWG